DEDLRLQLPGDQAVDPAGHEGRAAHRRHPAAEGLGQASVLAEVSRREGTTKHTKHTKSRGRPALLLSSFVSFVCFVVPCLEPLMDKRTILIQLDSDPHPSVFDRVVAIDAGVDELFSYGAVKPEQVAGLVHGAIFTRKPSDLKRTAIFVGG